jgi:hypothetical protein
MSVRARPLRFAIGSVGLGGKPDHRPFAFELRVISAGLVSSMPDCKDDLPWFCNTGSNDYSGISMTYVFAVLF